MALGYSKPSLRMRKETFVREDYALRVRQNQTGISRLSTSAQSEISKSITTRLYALSEQVRKQRLRNLP